MWHFFLKQFDSIDFLNCIYFICHKSIGQPKVRGGEGTAMLYKSKLNSLVRKIEPLRLRKQKHTHTQTDNAPL